MDNQQEQKPVEEPETQPKETGLGDVIRGRQFWLGFAAWYVALVALWGVLNGGDFSTLLRWERVSVLGVICVLPLSVIAIVVLCAVQATRRFGVGALFGFATTLVIVISLGSVITSILPPSLIPATPTPAGCF